MEKVKAKLNDVKISLSTITFRSIIVFLISTLLTFALLSFFIWLFTGPSVPPQSAINLIPNQGGLSSGTGEQKFNYRGVQVYNKPEVFNVKDNAYRFSQAEDVCRKYNAKLATKEELEQAQKDGANWCNLGWLMSQDAYYPTQTEQVTASENWPKQFQNGCGKVGINGGFYPAQLKLSVNCYGIKPTDLQNINPWNTVTKKWSQYS